MFIVAHILIILVFPIVFVGLINRTKALWAGRKGPPLLQLSYDLIRLMKKQPVYSESTSWVLPLSGIVLLSTTLIAALIVPIFPGAGIFAFQFDFVFLAYLLALGRIFLLLGAFDTGSSFEGMGASREAALSSLIEPAFFISLGTLSILASASSMNSISAIGTNLHQGNLPAVLLSVCALGIFIQAEAARVPIDDPNTHLELTMIHEVMILDHSGPDLALIQYASAMKMTLFAGFIAALLNPVPPETQPYMAIAVSISILAAVAIVIGLIESTCARIRLKAVPAYVFAAVLASAAALVISVIERWAR